MKIGYACTNFNNSHFTVNAVESLLSNRGSNDVEIVVVDNNSDKKSVNQLEALEENSENIHIIYNEINHGYFKGLNIGIEYLQTKNSDLDAIIIGNNDIIFPSDFFTNINNARNLLETHPVISPNIVTIDGIRQNPHVIHSISRTREYIYDLYYSNYTVAKIIKYISNKNKKVTRRGDEDNWKHASHIFQGHGSIYILTNIFLRKFKILWAPTFLMGEEYFLSTQLAKQGYSVYYEPSIEITHHWHASVGTIPGKQKWQFAREAHLLYKKHKSEHPKILPKHKTRNRI